MIDVNRLVSTSSKSYEKIVSQFKELGRDVNNELQIATKKTAKMGARVVAKEVQSELGGTISQKEVLRQVKYRPYGKTGQQITIPKGRRFSLKRFKPTQTPAGVTYTMRGQKKTTIGAFMGPRPRKKATKLNGHVFKRIGKARLPITKLTTASPWGVMNPNTSRMPLMDFAVDAIGIKFNEQIQRRIKSAIRRNSR